MRRRKGTSERGASLVEVGIVLPMLLLLAIGLAEVGFLVIDYVTVTNSARSGARTGATAAKSADADDAILQVVEEDICNLRFSDFDSVEVDIYRADPADGSLPTNLALINTYTNVGALACNNSAVHGFSCAGSCDWEPEDRDNIPPDMDSLGVRITYTHNSITGFVSSLDMTLQESAVMQLEPNTRG